VSRRGPGVKPDPSRSVYPNMETPRQSPRTSPGVIALTLLLTPPAWAAGEQVQFETEDIEEAAVDWAEAREHLREQARGATGIYIGEVLTSRDSFGARGFSEVVSLLVMESVRGPASAGDVFEFAIPREAAVVDKQLARPSATGGARVLVLVGPDGDLVGGEAMYVWEGGFFWKNQRPSLMQRPSLDRDWVTQMDPQSGWASFSLEEIREIARAERGPSAHRRRSKGD
jgi:hypothetical protein